MATGNVRILRMFRLLAFMTFACAAIGGAPLSFGETPKFEGVYKGSIALTTAAGGVGGLTSCNPSTKKFEQIMTVSGDRLYLLSKAVQVNIVFTGTVSPDGTVSGSGLTPPSAIAPGVNIMQMLTGKIENDQFIGSIFDRFCSYSVQLKK
jgi:hypothetical protein